MHKGESNPGLSLLRQTPLPLCQSGGPIQRVKTRTGYLKTTHCSLLLLFSLVLKDLNYVQKDLKKMKQQLITNRNCLNIVYFFTKANTSKNYQWVNLRYSVLVLRLF